MMRSWCALAAGLLVCFGAEFNRAAEKGHKHIHPAIEFDLVSVKNGRWTDPQTWKPSRVPKAGDRVKIARDTTVAYDAESDDVIRLVQIVGELRFVRDRNTLLNVAIMKVQASEACSESGFACDFEGVNLAGEPLSPQKQTMPLLEIGTPESPIPAQYTARIRLHYIKGMNKDDAPALVCCSAKMEIHGAPLQHTWLKLNADATAGDATVKAAGELTGWRVGDEIIVTGAGRDSTTEERTIAKIEGQTIHLNKPLEEDHVGSGEYRGEVANLSRNVIIESADPQGERGHTLYHAFSDGGVSYARFAHLGKKGVLGRYAMHFHLIGATMRGSQVKGASIVDSHNRWITIHGTEYLVVRDCVGYRSAGHGYFMEDGTEVNNLLDHNLGVQAYAAKKLPGQVLPFDQNEGAAFWWANGRNSFTRNVACENDEYGYRYDMQHSRYFSSTLPVTMPDGQVREVDVRTIPIWRFDGNESHNEHFYGLVVAANAGGNGNDWTAPDEQHPHHIRNLKVWRVHYGFRAQSPCMLIEDVHISDSAYGIYRPAYDRQVYRNLRISRVGAEPFNRGLDDRSEQYGVITVDGLTFDTGYGNSSTPLIQISDHNMSGQAATHIRNLTVNRPERFQDRWPLVNRGGGPRPTPKTDKGVPIYLHDYFGKGRHARVASTAAKDYNANDKYREMETVTGNESRVIEEANVDFPKVLSPIDDTPPATIITSIESVGGLLELTGVSHDNGEIVSIKVNGKKAEVISREAGVVDWRISLPGISESQLVAQATDKAGNVEKTPHMVRLK